MNEVKHTPGPWFSYPDTVGSNVDIAVADKYGQVICDIGGAGLETRLANAQLIAAGPELLAACERLVRAQGEDVEAVIDAMDMARAAIAKATGK